MWLVVRRPLRTVKSQVRTFQENSTNVSSQIPDPVKIGKKVLYNNHIGTIRFVGRTHFQPGDWVGIELSEPGKENSKKFHSFCCFLVGKNDGTFNGVKYFGPLPFNHGTFVRKSNVVLLN